MGIMSEPKVIEKSKATFTYLWTGKWKLDKSDMVVPTIARLPTAPQNTCGEGEGHWLKKGYVRQHLIPPQPPEGTLEILLDEKDKAFEYAKRRIEEEKKTAPKEDNVNDQILQLLTKMNDRIERLEDGTKQQDDREHDRRDDSGCGCKQTTKAKPKANRNAKGSGNRRGPKSGQGKR